MAIPWQSIFYKFQNREVYTFEKYFNICTFNVDQHTNEIIYTFDIKNDAFRFYVLWIKSSLLAEMSDLNIFLGAGSNDDEKMEFINGAYREKKLNFDEMDGEFAPLNFYKDLADDLIEVTDPLPLAIQKPKSVESILKKYYTLNSFEIESDKESIYYNYTIEGYTREYSLMLLVNTNGKSDLKEISFGYEESGKFHNCFISLSLLRDLANFFNTEG